jgi:hypothetical protein
MSVAVVPYDRYTTLVGNGSFVSRAFDVTGYKSVDIEVMLVSSIGSPSSVDASLEMSPDMITWSAADSETGLAAGTPVTLSKSAPARFVRVKMTVTGGTNPGITFFASGVARES